MKILLRIPITGLCENAIDESLYYLRAIANHDTDISHIQVKDELSVIETNVDHAIGAAEVIKCLRNVKSIASM